MSGGGTVQRCYYEVLEVSRRADDEEIRKAYRKAALRWHPDRNVGNEEEANERFKEVQRAYSVLSDPDERAWYDSHRLAILRGEADPGAPSDGKASDDGFNIWAFFTSSAFDGFDDEEGGFYRVYNDAFATISKLEVREDFSSDESESEDDEDSDGLDDSPEAQERRKKRSKNQKRRKQRQQEQQDRARPSFGTSKSTWEEVDAFYKSWKNFRSKRSFASHDVYNRSDATGRKIKRAVDKENRRAREKARTEYSDRIRHLAEFVAKLDPRVKEHRAAVLKQQQEEQERAEKERAQQDRESEARRRKLLAERDRALQEEIERLSMELDAAGAFNPFKGDLYERKPIIKTANAEDDEDDGDKPAATAGQKNRKGKKGGNAQAAKRGGGGKALADDDELFCAVCNKAFKSVQQLKNHQQSKKHKEAVKRVMDEVAMDGDEEMLELLRKQEEEEEEEKQDEQEEEEEEEEHVPMLSRKERKKLKKQKNEARRQQKKDARQQQKQGEEGGKEEEKEDEDDKEEDGEQEQEQEADEDDEQRVLEKDMESMSLRERGATKKERKKQAKLRKMMKLQSTSPFDEPEEEEEQPQEEETATEQPSMDVINADDGEQESNPNEAGEAVKEDGEGEDGGDETVGGVQLTEKQKKRAQRKEKKAQKKVLQSARAANAAAAAKAYAASREEEQHSRSNKREKRRADGEEAAAASSGNVQFVCGKCGEQFSGRNALFTHLRKTGHAIPL